ncbi:hypothetical protein [Wohlfahrtiimonas chitiniclastica]|uniref:hypothetical protein n=1 Tax=Wohlfahrtiimonas chitiniclastica TaxID=400946 RepID=UPI001BCCB27C|nr:hypothetical protein [Wohlfahrtiimonas chitiniclastica]MBS7819030.1 hypothetical protein [Wohlfahrtiimonas chitiniclastica]
METNHQISFIYRNIKGEEKHWTILLLKVFPNHFSGKELGTDAYKTFKKERVVSYDANASAIIEAWPIEPYKNKQTIASIKSYNPNELFEVCFTGFKKADKERLISLAKEKNMYVAADVTNNLGALVCGYNAGPKKIEKAINSATKVEIMDESEFLHFITTGEVKNS